MSVTARSVASRDKIAKALKHHFEKSALFTPEDLEAQAEKARLDFASQEAARDRRIRDAWSGTLEQLKRPVLSTMGIIQKGRNRRAEESRAEAAKQWQEDSETLGPQIRALQTGLSGLQDRVDPAELITGQTKDERDKAIRASVSAIEDRIRKQRQQLQDAFHSRADSTQAGLDTVAKDTPTARDLALSDVSEPGRIQLGDLTAPDDSASISSAEPAEYPRAAEPAAVSKADLAPSAEFVARPGGPKKPSRIRDLSNMLTRLTPAQLTGLLGAAGTGVGALGGLRGAVRGGLTGVGAGLGATGALDHATPFLSNLLGIKDPHIARLISSALGAGAGGLGGYMLSSLIPRGKKKEEEVEEEEDTVPVRKAASDKTAFYCCVGNKLVVTSGDKSGKIGTCTKVDRTSTDSDYVDEDGAKVTKRKEDCKVTVKFKDGTTQEFDSPDGTLKEYYGDKDDTDDEYAAKVPNEEFPSEGKAAFDDVESEVEKEASEGQTKLADLLARVINGDTGLEQIIERLKTAKSKYKKKAKKKTTSCK